MRAGVDRLQREGVVEVDVGDHRDRRALDDRLRAPRRPCRAARRRGRGRRRRRRPCSICSIVASRFAVSVFVIVWTATGAPPPIGTSPTNIWRLEAIGPFRIGAGSARPPNLAAALACGRPRAYDPPCAGGTASLDFGGDAALRAPSAHGAFHLMKVVEVFPGTNAAPDKAFIELQMYAAGQNQVAGHNVTVYNAAGAVTATVPMTAAVPNGENQRTILLGDIDVTQPRLPGERGHADRAHAVAPSASPTPSRPTASPGATSPRPARFRARWDPGPARRDPERVLDRPLDHAELPDPARGGRRHRQLAPPTSLETTTESPRSNLEAPTETPCAASTRRRLRSTRRRASRSRRTRRSSGSAPTTRRRPSRASSTASRSSRAPRRTR